ncbi:MAG: class I SAM-dependent methyltransferase [Candidatus Eremiobacteraeota bacterium]|nr:class I SAM-dependent methyltransferase [Candidatus Eremiobacteraeota bacterium]
MSDGWEESASAWIAEMGEFGDYSRQFVLDAPMMERARAKEFGYALDVGCGEGRFCRMLQRCGIRTTGIDTTPALVRRAADLDPLGDYRLGKAETLEFSDSTFDLVVSYLTLIDIADVSRAISEMARVLRPGGTLLIANLNGFATAASGGWTVDSNGRAQFSMDDYLEERAEWAQWRGIRIQSWHRPLSVYMSLLIAEGLDLRYFSEPAPTGGERAKRERYRRVPLFLVMEWEKPANA